MVTNVRLFPLMVVFGAFYTSPFMTTYLNALVILKLIKTKKNIDSSIPYNYAVFLKAIFFGDKVFKKL